MGYIYRIYNDINDKSYIGLTTNTVEARWKKHLSNSKYVQYHLYKAMCLYGINHFFIETLEQVEDEKLSEREQYWIKYYDSFNNGYNETVGGEGNQVYSKEKFYNLWDDGYSVGDIAKIVGCVSSTVREALVEYENYSIEKSIQRGREKNKKRVYQFDLTGKFIASFSSTKEAGKKTNTSSSSINSCCNGKYGFKTANNYLWLYEEDKDKINEVVKKLDNGRRQQKVAQLDKDGNVIAIFDSAKIAAQSFGRPKDSHICDCCKGKRKTCFGYRWRYER